MEYGMFNVVSLLPRLHSPAFIAQGRDGCI